MGSAARQTLFISHASPEDNAFTLWLGAKLTALGYSVFADILRLRGGDDWERVLENEIRLRAVKVLLVATPHGVQKQGVRNEITIAAQTAKKIEDSAFIVPLRLAPFEPQLQIAHAQYLNFTASWAAGLSDLLALIEEWRIPRREDASATDAWKSIQLKDAREVGDEPEHLISNWLAIDSTPPKITYYDFKSGISLGAAQRAITASTVAIASHNRGFLSFAPLQQLQDYFGPDLPLKIAAEQSTDEFLAAGWSAHGLRMRDARSKFTDLSRQALDAFFFAKGLHSFELPSRRLAWWPTSANGTLKRATFAWSGGPSGSRQLVGRSEKRGFFWHYGVDCWAQTAPLPHIRVAGRVIFTSNGHDPIGNALRLHRMRRSFCKGWRNDKWRDLLLAFWFWIAEGAAFVDAPLGDGVALRLHLPPMTFDAPFGIKTQDDTGESDDEDDAEIDGADDSDDDPDEPDDQS